jgi:hypothetical protein
MHWAQRNCQVFPISRDLKASTEKPATVTGLIRNKATVLNVETKRRRIVLGYITAMQQGCFLGRTEIEGRCLPEITDCTQPICCAALQISHRMIG